MSRNHGWQGKHTKDAEWRRKLSVSLHAFYSRRTHKRCPHCKTAKRITARNWSTRKTARGYRIPSGWCRVCETADRKERYRRNRSALAIKWWRGKLKRCYGLTVEAYEAKVREQDNRCAICRQPPKRPKLDIDHDHKTKKARGLLCSTCNLALGGFMDDVVLLRAAIAYLKRWHVGHKDW